MGGVGKSQIATEYIYRHTADYSLVWWMGAEEPAALASEFARLAVEMNLPEKDSRDQSAIVSAVKQRLEQLEGWLLVYDNAAGPEDVKAFLPRGRSGHVIITSRNPGWGGVAKTIKIEEFKHEESIEYLAKRTHQDDPEAASDLADELGDLPLALSEAAAYMETTGTSMSEYLDLFRTQREELWKDQKPPEGYPDTVGTAWSISMKKVVQESPEGADLLSMCSFLAPDNIQLDLFSMGEEHIPEPLRSAASDRLAMNRAIRVLRQYSLIDTADGAVSVHRLVQAVVRDSMGIEQRKVWSEAALGIVRSVFPSGNFDVGAWDICAALLPHALSFSAHAERTGVEPGGTAILLNQVGSYLYGRAEYADARRIYERALKIDEAAYGPNHPNVAIHVNNLGGVLKALGDLKGAKQHYERALLIFRHFLGDEHPSTKIVRGNLDAVLQEMG